MAATSTETIIEALSGLEDRPTAIVASEFGRLFTGYGPLATLSARIMLAYNLKIINADARHDFRIIKDIRNQFAHNYLPLSFKTDKISAKWDNLKLSIKLIPPLSERIHDDARGKYIKSIVKNMSLPISNMILTKYEKILLEADAP